MKQPITKEESESFMRELSELTNKHGIKVDSCGCCGSPWLSKVSKHGRYVNDGPHHDDMLSFVDDDGKEVFE